MGGWVDRTRSLRMRLLSAARRLGWRMGDSDTTRQRLLAIPSPVAAARVAAVVGLRGRGRRRRGGEGRADPDGLYFGAAVATPTRKGSFALATWRAASIKSQDGSTECCSSSVQSVSVVLCSSPLNSSIGVILTSAIGNISPSHRIVSLDGQLSQSLSSQEVPGIQRERATVTLCLS